MTKEAEAFVYMWYDGNNKMFYIGVHKGTPDDIYAHSSSRMQSFTMDNIPKGFRRKILATGSYEDMLKFEVECMCNRQVPINEKYYNMAIHAPRDSKSVKKRQMEGIRRAKIAGKYKGRKAKFDRKKVIKLRLEGLKIKEICEKMGCSPAYAHRAMQIPTEKKPAIFELLLDGAEIEEIAKLIDVEVDKIKIYLKQFDTDEDMEREQRNLALSDDDADLYEI